MKKILIIITVLLACTSIFSGWKLYTKGDQKEIEQVLSAVVWELDKEGYSEDDIADIKVMYNWSKGGALPYEVYVVFKEDTSTAKIYNWGSIEKQRVSLWGESAV